MQAYEEDILRDCDLIEQYQRDLDEDLDFITAKLEDDERALEEQAPTEDDYERETTFQLCEQLDLHLTQMENSLKKLVSDFNETRSGIVPAAGASEANPVSKVVEVLNEHHNSLVWLDSRARQLQKDIFMVNRELGMAQD